MIGYFQQSRWCETRKKIHAMSVGDSMTFPASEYPNAKASVERLNFAYEGEREWKLKSVPGTRVGRNDYPASNVTRLK